MESVCRGNLTGGSNPSLSATNLFLESKFLMSKPDVRDFTQEEMSDLSAFITRTLLAAGASDHIRYESKGESRHASAGPIAHHESKPGRNEPCPCGSGRKYKNCCGR